MRNKTTIILTGILLIFSLIYLWLRKENASFDKSQADFAVKDTANILSVTLTDYISQKKEGSVKLLRKGKGWVLAGSELPVFQMQMNSFLQMLHGLEVRQTLNKAGQQSVYRHMKDNHTRVEIELQNGDTKTFYVGGPTPDGLGTMMMKNDGSQPYIMALPGHRGYLRPYFATNPSEWTEKLVFNHPAYTIKSVTMTANTPDSSFTLVQRANYWTLQSGESVDTTFTGRYIRQFNRVYAQELFQKPRLRDSLTKIKPFLTLTVEAQNTQTLQIYYRDINSYFAISPNDNDIRILQRFVFDKFIVKRQQFFGMKKYQ